jgi:hypothetical protein
VREWRQALDEENRKLVGTDIAAVEYEWPIGMSTCWALGGGLHEVRTDLPENRIARVLFRVDQGQMGSPARVRQEDTYNARRRSEVCAETNEGGREVKNSHLGSSFDEFLSPRRLPRQSPR